MDGVKSIRTFCKHVRLIVNDDGKTSMELKYAILDKIQPLLAQKSFDYTKAGSSLEIQTKQGLLQVCSCVCMCVCYLSFYPLSLSSPFSLPLTSLFSVSFPSCLIS